MTDSLDRRAYVQAVLAFYLRWPDTPARSRPADRALAELLYQQEVSLSTVRQALLLAIARRHLRAPTAPPLAGVRSLHYFLPVIEELLETPLPDGYTEYLQRKLAALGLTPPLGTGD